MRFRVADQDAVDVPDAFARALRGDEGARAIWDGLTPGKRRAVAQHVASAKTDPTRTRRVTEALDALRDHGGDLRAWRRDR